jgi:hypothetical protein
MRGHGAVPMVGVACQDWWVEGGVGGASGMGVARRPVSAASTEDGGRHGVVVQSLNF